MMVLHQAQISLKSATVKFIVVILWPENTLKAGAECWRIVANEPSLP